MYLNNSDILDINEHRSRNYDRMKLQNHNEKETNIEQPAPNNCISSWRCDGAVNMSSNVYHYHKQGGAMACIA